MDLSTEYLGFLLEHPIVPGASPLADDLDGARQLEDAGAPLITLRSLFEEQIVAEELAAHDSIEDPSHSFAEAVTYLPQSLVHGSVAEAYLEHVRRVKEAVSVPVIASLNGVTPGGWLRYAEQIEQAGADALELNLYEIAIDTETTGRAIEQRELETVSAVAESISIPLAVKLSPFYSSIAHHASCLAGSGADALVMFNRFYQPTIDPEQLSIEPTLHLSEPGELTLRLRWIAAVHGQVDAQLAVTGGVHDELGALRAIMAGATVVQTVSALLRHGPAQLRRMRDGLERWLVEHEYDNLDQARGSMSLRKCGDRPGLERANYMHVLQSWSSRAPH